MKRKTPLQATKEDGPKHGMAETQKPPHDARLFAIEALSRRPVLAFTIPRAVPSWNELYKAPHWGDRNKMATTWHEVTQLYAMAAGINTLLPGGCIHPPVVIVITRHGVRPLDVDNVCTKLVVDGLKHWLGDDDPAHVLTVIPFSLKADKCNERTEVEIYECQ